MHGWTPCLKSTSLTSSCPPPLRWATGGQHKSESVCYCTRWATGGQHKSESVCYCTRRTTDVKERKNSFCSRISAVFTLGSVSQTVTSGILLWRYVYLFTFVWYNMLMCLVFHFIARRSVHLSSSSLSLIHSYTELCLHTLLVDTFHGVFHSHLKTLLLSKSFPP